MTARRLTKRRNVLDNRKDEVIATIVSGATYSETAQQYGVSKSAITYFILRHEDEIRALEAKAAQAAEDYAIAVKVNRIAEYDADWQKLKAVQDARAADQRYAKHPGWSTGLLVHQLKSIGAGDNAMVVDEFKVDTGLIAQKVQLAKAAADELGQIPRPDVHNTLNVGILVRQLAGYNPEDIG